MLAVPWGGRVGGIIVAVVVSSVLVTGVAHAADGPELGVVYDSNGEGSGLEIQNLYVAQPATDEKPGLVRFFTVTDCGAGDLEASLDADGRIKGRGLIYDIDDDDRDVVIDVRVKGELGPREGAGTLRARRTKGPRCTDELDWEVGRERELPDYRRLEAVIASPNPDYNPFLVLNATGVYAIVPQGDEDDATTIARIDPATNEVDWKVDLDVRVDDAVATEDAVWLVDGASATVHRFDPATRALVAEVSLGPPATDAADPTLALAVVAASDGTVFASVAETGLVQRIESSSNTVTATFELGGPLAHLVAGPVGLYAEVVLPTTGQPDEGNAEEERPLRTGDNRPTEHSWVVLVDPTSGAPRAQIDTDALWDLDSGPAGLYTSEGGQGRLVRRDPVTLAELVVGNFPTRAIAVAPPGVWISGFDTAAVTPDSLLERAFVEDIATRFPQGLVAGFGSIWVAEFGAVNRFRDGDTPA